MTTGGINRQPATAGGSGRPATIGVMLRHLGEKGGIVVYTENILKHMLELDRRNRYVLFLPSAKFLGRFSSYPNVTPVVIKGGSNLLARLYWDQLLVPFQAAKHGVDVFFNPKLSVPLAGRGKRTFTMHGLEQFAEESLFLWYDRLYFKAVMPLYCARADAVFVMTETGKRDLLKYLRVPQQKIQVVPESYNEKCHYIEDRSVVEAMRSAAGLPEKFILFLGGVTPLKNLPALFRALQILKGKGFPHRLVLAGFNRWSFEEELALIGRLGLTDDIVQTGFLDDDRVVGIYNMAECFVLPSYYEGFGIPILEAQASGCPVIVSTGGAATEVAGPGGALSFDPDSPEGLARCLERVLTDPSVRQSLVKRGFENAANYSWASTARRTLDVLEAVCGAG